MEDGMYRVLIGDDDPAFLREAEAMACRALDGEGLLRDKDYEVVCYARRPRSWTRFWRSPGAARCFCWT